MASPEYKKGFSERVWDYTLWGTIGVIAIFAAIDLFNHHIPLLENPLNPVN